MHPHPLPRMGLFLASVLLPACGLFDGEPLPDVGPIIVDDSNDCDAIPPYDVDASASEIACDRTYHYRIEAQLLGSEGINIDEQMDDVPGSSVCCETCALVNNADMACGERCKFDLCTRAQSDHMTMAQALEELCEDPFTCGFDMETCMTTDTLHPQLLDFVDDLQDTSYALEANCTAYAVEPARPDGLFEYLEGLDGVPGSQTMGPGTGTNVVQYCIDLAADMLTGGGSGGNGDGGNGDGGSGQDSTGGNGTGTGESNGSGSSGGNVPERIPCGPFA